MGAAILDLLNRIIVFWNLPIATARIEARGLLESPGFGIFDAFSLLYRLKSRVFAWAHTCNSFFLVYVGNLPLPIDSCKNWVRPDN